MTDIITTKSEKGQAILDYLTRELGLPGKLRALKVDVSSGVFLVDCQFVAPFVPGKGEALREDPMDRIKRAATELEAAMAAVHGRRFEMHLESEAVPMMPREEPTAYVYQISYWTIPA